MQGKNVIILMACYNGSSFLSEQINSILRQTYTKWVLVLRDDGSDDGTVDLIETFKNQDSRIERITSMSAYPGSVSNFSILYSYARTKYQDAYFMFSDQDDIWLPGKIATYVDELSRYPSSLCALFYSEMQYIDEMGDLLAYNLKRYKDLQFRHLLTQNYVYGCTIFMTPTLVQVIEEIPLLGENHDYWLALVTSLFGQLIFIDKKLTLYRQHNSNVTQNLKNRAFKNRIQRYTSHNSQYLKVWTKKIVMLVYLRSKFSQSMNRTDLEILDEYLYALKEGSLKIISTIIRFRIYRKGIFQNLFYIFFVVRNRKVIKAAFSYL